MDKSMGGGNHIIPPPTPWALASGFISSSMGSIHGGYSPSRICFTKEGHWDCRRSMEAQGLSAEGPHVLEIFMDPEGCTRFVRGALSPIPLEANLACTMMERS